MRKPAAKSFAGWLSITACTNTSPLTQRFADGSSRANLFPPRRSGVRSGNCTTMERCSCGLSLRTYIRMAYESSIPFADIRDFREAEINGIPALFTMSRLDSETLPADFHSCEVMGGRGSDFQWLVPLALANFTGTFVSRQPLLREGQAYAEIRRYGIMTRTAFDEWSENNNF